ncbi:MAG: AAA family ATPase [Bacteroidetes bacterium]|nr:AAA family ATPase [Bacteroidota bacterium]
MDYFQNLREQLKAEKTADQLNFQQQTAHAAPALRRASGLTWYPIAIRGTEPTRAEYISVELERTTHLELPHQFRFGAAAALFSNHNPKEDRINGIITHASGNKMRITLHDEELPDWSRNGKLGVDLLFDDNSYNEMEAALKTASTRKEQAKEGRLIRVLCGEQNPVFDPLQPTVPNARLNPSQEQAIQHILAAQDIAIIHGPPGTGKTTTLVAAIKALQSRQKQQILVCAPSNTAVDLLAEKLSQEGFNVLRVGNPARVSEQLSTLTLEAKIAEHPANKDIKKLKKQAAEFKNMAHKYKRNFGRAEREQRKALFDEAHRILREVEQTEQYISNEVFDRADIIVSTLVGANHFSVRERRYETVVIDEAGQALEPACWIPILKAKKLIMAGDHCQLPPTIKSEGPSKIALSTTLLEKCIRLYPESVTMLETQYRMHEHIMSYSSKVFYKNALRAHASVAHHLLFAGDQALLFIDTAGCGFEEKLEGSSSTNPEEAAFCIKHLVQLTEVLGQKTTDTASPSIAVVSPYKQQVALLKELSDHAPELRKWDSSFSVNTIDAFQGQERDIVYISLTRSNSDNSIGFLADVRRMNVAMTRARKKLVIIGDSATLSVLPFYNDLIEYAQAIEGYASAWEWM